MKELTVTARVSSRPPSAPPSRQESRDTREVVIRLLFDEDAAPWVWKSASYIEQRERCQTCRVTLRVRHLDERSSGC